MAETKSDRTRNWAFFVYPESAPVNWVNIIDEMHIEWCRSPLHDKDINETTGELKKAHYHVILHFDTDKSYSQIKEITDLLNQPIPQRIKSIKGSVRYLIHYDNPEKYQYDKKDIQTFGGFEIESYFTTSTDRYKCIKDMINYILENQITEVIDFTNYCMNEHYTDWFPLLCDNSMLIIKENIISNAYRLGKRK